MGFEAKLLRMYTDACITLKTNKKFCEYRMMERFIYFWNKIIVSLDKDKDSLGKSSLKLAFSIKFSGSFLIVWI